MAWAEYGYDDDGRLVLRDDYFDVGGGAPTTPSKTTTYSDEGDLLVEQRESWAEKWISPDLRTSFEYQDVTDLVVAQIEEELTSAPGEPESWSLVGRTDWARDPLGLVLEARLDQDGDLVSQLQHNHSLALSSLDAARLLPDSGMLVAGRGPKGAWTSAAARLDAEGEVAWWVEEIEEDGLVDLAVNAEGTIALVGRSGWEEHAWLHTLDPGGALGPPGLWSTLDKSFEPAAIEATSAGGFLVPGRKVLDSDDPVAVLRQVAADGALVADHEVELSGAGFVSALEVEGGTLVVALTDIGSKVAPAPTNPSSTLLLLHTSGTPIGEWSLGTLADVGRLAALPDGRFALPLSRFEASSGSLGASTPTEGLLLVGSLPGEGQPAPPLEELVVSSHSRVKPGERTLRVRWGRFGPRILVNAR